MDSQALWTTVTWRSTWVYSYTIQDGNKSYYIADLIICSLLCTLPTHFSKFAVNVLSDFNCLSLNAIYCRKTDYFLRMLNGNGYGVWSNGAKTFPFFKRVCHRAKGWFWSSDPSSFTLSGPTSDPRPWPEGNQQSLAKFEDIKLKNERKINFFPKCKTNFVPALSENSAGETRQDREE